MRYTGLKLFANMANLALTEFKDFEFDEQLNEDLYSKLPTSIQEQVILITEEQRYNRV